MVVVAMMVLMGGGVLPDLCPEPAPKNVKSQYKVYIYVVYFTRT